MVVEVAQARDYGEEEVVEALLDVQGFLLVEEKHHQSKGSPTDQHSTIIH